MNLLKGDPIKAKRYRRFKGDNTSIDDRGTPEQRLGDALVNQGRDTGDLLDLLSSQGSKEYIRELPSFGFNFGEEETDSPEYYYSSPGRGRAFVGGNGMTMYQPPSKEEGQYQGTGRAVLPDDLEYIMGGNSPASSSQLRNAAQMLRDPAIMQYFMDIYSEAGRARKPNTITLKPKKQKTSGSGGCNTLHIVDGKPRWKRDSSCKDPKSWQQ